MSTNTYTGLENETDDDLVNRAYATDDKLTIALAQRLEDLMSQVAHLESYDDVDLTADEMRQLEEAIILNTETTVELLGVLAKHDEDGLSAKWLDETLTAALNEENVNVA